MTSDSTPATTPAIMTAITFAAPAGGGRRHGRRTARPSHRWSASSHGPCRRRRPRRRGLANCSARCDRRRSILLDVDLRAIAGGDAGNDGVDDRPRSLRPRVVRRHDHAICHLRRYRAHLRTLACIAITAAPEHHEDGPVGDLAGRAEDLGQAVGRVGVVDDDGRRALAVDVDTLEASRHGMNAGQPLGDGVELDAERRRGGRRGERVHHVEAATQADLDVPSQPRECVSVRRDDEVRHVADRVRHHLDRGGVEEQATVRIVDVGHPSPGEVRSEQARLGPEVLLDRAVQVEVIRAEVREDGNSEPCPVDPVQRQGV